MNFPRQTEEIDNEQIRSLGLHPRTGRQFLELISVSVVRNLIVNSDPSRCSRSHYTKIAGVCVFEDASAGTRGLPNKSP